MTFGHQCGISVVFCLALVVAISGCSNDPFPVHPVSGLVTYKGELLADASIIFIPRDPNGRSAPGLTRHDGTFELMTVGARRLGAMIGDYDVLISKEFPVDAQGRQTTFEAIEEAMAHLPENVSRQPRMVSAIPEKYSDFRSPILQATVKRGQNDFVFDLGN